jgi:replicative superfamily II helicase
MLINTLPRDYIINNDKQMTTLVTRAKQLNNQSLRNMVPCGIAFHNASLNYQDRRIV